MRVGLEFPFVDESWIGGVSGISHLINALWSLDDRRIEPVLVASPRTPDSLLAAMPPILTLRTSLVDTSHVANRIGRAWRRGLGRNLPMEVWLKRHGIKVFSHCAPLGRKATVPTIGYIPDFGYKYFPELYSSKITAFTDSGIARTCDEYNILLLASRAVEKDYRSFFPAAKAPSVILNIVPSRIPQSASSRDDLVLKYGIPSSYFYSPNQFWVHKNHLTILEALAIAKDWGSNLHVVCTGRPFDRRRPGHFDFVIKRAKELGVKDRFHVLGIVPFADAMDLMRHSMAVLSASVFEGWGISVAEATMLGKAVVLSDIPVFHEHEPERARYFDPLDPTTLAKQLIATVHSHVEAEDLLAQAKANERQSQRVSTYARHFEDIAIKVGFAK
jgi:glycosyltransferase involved in cell wall biosynthesis